MSSEAMNELDALIVSNIGDLDAAAHRLWVEIQPHVAREMNKMAEEWVNKNDWRGVFDWFGSGLWVAPPEWESQEDGWCGKFYLDGGEDDSFGKNDFEAEEDIFWLTRFCHKSRGQLGFRWYYDDGLAMRPGRWRAFLRANPEIKEAIAKNGFV